MKTIIAGIVVLALSLLGSPLRAQEVFGNATIVVDDGNERRCIDTTQDSFSMMVKHIKQARDRRSAIARWFTADKSFGIKIEATVTGPTASGQPSVTLVKAASVRASQFNDSDLMQMTNEVSIFSKFALKNDVGAFTNLSFSMNFVNVRGDSMLAKTTRALIDVTAKAPLPPNPYTPGLQYLGMFADTMIRLASDNDDDETKPLINKTYDLSTSSACTRGLLRTGLFAQIFDYPGGTEATGFVKATDSANYCYRAFGGDEDFSVKFWKKSSTADACTSVDNAQVLLNPQVVFLVNAYDIGTGAPRERAVPAGFRELVARTSPEARRIALSKVHESLGIEKLKMSDFDAVADQVVGLGKPVPQKLPALAIDIIVNLARCSNAGVTPTNCP